jgi:2-methylcitrate dehydratase PrpD
MSITQKVANFIGAQHSLPSHLQEASAAIVLDSIGCALAAVKTEPGQVVQHFVEAEGTGREIVLGTGQKAGSTTAAYANARLINLIDQDETYMILGHHANAALGAVLALADRCNLDGATALRAFAVGFEVGARVGNFMGAPLKVDPTGKVAGWNFPGPVIGTFASCAAASACLALNPSQIENALGICAQYLPVNGGEFWEAGRRRAKLPSVKYEDCGLNAQAGLMAALMAHAGVTGTLGTFEPDNHVWEMARPGSQPNPSALTDRLGVDWRLTRTSFKPWPSCRWFHYVQTALQLVLDEHSIDPSTIEAIELYSSSASCFFSDPEIGADIIMDASFSLPHCAAMMVHRVPPGPAWFDPGLVRREDIATLRRKVKVSLEPSVAEPSSWGNASAWGEPDAPLSVPSRAVVRCRDRVYEARSDFALGDPWLKDRPFTSADVKKKFLSLAGSLAPGSAKWEERIDDVARRVLSLQQEPRLIELLKVMSP